MARHHVRPAHAAARAALAVLGAWLLVPACRTAAEGRWAVCARIRAPAVTECSGIVESRRHPGVFWVHNDSGDRARFFGIDRRGEVLLEVEVEGATNVDWEDIAVDDSGHVYLGDCGNNRNTRRDLVVYVVDEPDPLQGGPRRTVPVRRRLPFHYADQHSFPDSADFNFDCEALFWADDRLGLLTKHRSDLRTTLYWLDPRRTSEQELVPVRELEIGSPVTGADCSADGRRLVVLSYQYIHFFERRSVGTDFFRDPGHRTLIEGRQCEGVCFDAGRVLYTNEQREIYCVSDRYLRTHDRFLPEPVRLTAVEVTPCAGTGPPGWERTAERIPFDRFVQVTPESPGASAASPRGSSAAFAESVDVRIGWCPEGVLVRARWPSALGRAGCSPEWEPGTPALYLMLGTPGSGRPCLEAGQQVWAAIPDGESLTVQSWPPEAGQPRCEPPGASTAPRSISRASRPGFFDLEAFLPVPGVPELEAGQNVLFGVVVVETLCAESVELGWAANLDMQPLGNPLLWGQVRLAPRAPAR